jgi:hypothetical protein
MAISLGVPQSSLPLILPDIGNLSASKSATPLLRFLG